MSRIRTLSILTFAACVIVATAASVAIFGPTIPSRSYRPVELQLPQDIASMVDSVGSIKRYAFIGTLKEAQELLDGTVDYAIERYLLPEITGGKITISVPVVVTRNAFGSEIDVEAPGAVVIYVEFPDNSLANQARILRLPSPRELAAQSN
jgi:hypothetical protein